MPALKLLVLERVCLHFHLICSEKMFLDHDLDHLRKIAVVVTLSSLSFWCRIRRELDCFLAQTEGERLQFKAKNSLEHDKERMKFPYILWQVKGKNKNLTHTH